MYSIYVGVMDDIIQDVEIADDYWPPNFAFAVMMIFYYCISIIFWLTVSAACLPLFVLGLFVWGKPPMIPTWSSYYKYFVAAFTEGKLEENVPTTNRMLVILIVLCSLIKIPVNGLCWYIDELIFSSYHKVDIEEPVVMITAPRSGSTQLHDYLLNDTRNFIAPTVFEGLFPYIWAWKLVMPIILGLGLQDYLYNNSLFGKEATKRHRFMMLRAESWAGMLQAWHFGVCNFSLGSSFMNWGYSFTSCMMKKVMYCHGKPQQRMLLKGHFLLNARNFELQYPKAKFFVTLRNPVDRFGSHINFLKVLSEEGKTLQGLFPATWRVIRDHVIQTQVPYCEQEMLFYKKPSHNKLVIPFTIYVNNLSATLQCIYSFCNIPIPDDVLSNAIRIQQSTHNFTKRRASYDPRFNRSLASLGVNKKRLKEHLNEYIEWINSIENQYET